LNDNANTQTVLILYNLGIRVYHLAILVASLFNKKARLWIHGRKRIFEQISTKIDPASSVIWFHCSSLGEFEQGRPVMEKIHDIFPGRKILLTFFSPSGYEIRKNYSGADYIFYLPLDTRRNALKFLSLVKPETVFFIKYEYWFHFLSHLQKMNVKIYLISGIFRPGQVFFKWYGKWFREILRSFHHLFVQDNESAGLLKSIGFENVTICRDTRFDRVYSIAQKAIEFPLIRSFTNGKMTLIAGSTWPPDETIIVRFINENKLPVKYIIAPHEIHEHGITQLQESILRKTVRYTSLDESEIKEADVLIIDTIGILSSVYQYGSMAYIGGGFGKGIHNILEAATFGLPIIFGPNFQKFHEANDLIKLNGAFSIKNLGDFNRIINTFIANHQAFKTAGENSREYVRSNLGATDIITKFVRSSL
jgi:3-deoxy-D-manno-octulosonic-acid transferase